MQSVATLIIPKGPITVAKSAYNMRVGAYGFGFTTTNSISNLFSYAMVRIFLIIERKEHSRDTTTTDGV